MQKIISESYEHTLEIGEKIGNKVKQGDVTSINGNLGAGKTVLIKGIGKVLKIKDEITSPSFALISEYRGILTLYHIDLYRIDSIYEIEDLGLEEIISGKGVTVIEWGEKAKPLLPEKR